MSERRDILGRVMTETGMTQSELSRLSGVRQPSISQMLSGRVEPSDEMLRRLLSCMGFGLEVVRRPVRLELSRSVRRSWLLHRRISAHLDPPTLERWTPRILDNIERIREQVRGEPHRTNIERWRHLVGERDVTGLQRVLTGLDTDAVQMREVSPVRGLLTQRERDEVLRQQAV
ncbi:MAG: helix-turn-helix transcriptional regulator [Actinomycetota bacterium]